MSQLSLLQNVARPVAPGGASDEWYTPRYVFEPLNREFRFTVDVCATDESAKVERFYSKWNDGLAQSWADERCWMNPPYSDIRPWAEKAWTESKFHGATVVGLLPAWTDRRWWHDFIEPYRRGVETRFVQGRIRFGISGDPDGLNQRGGGTFPSVIVVWRG
jgi:phage N-6-adenine-methyltransferase